MPGWLDGTLIFWRAPTAYALQHFIARDDDDAALDGHLERQLRGVDPAADAHGGGATALIDGGDLLAAVEG